MWFYHGEFDRRLLLVALPAAARWRLKGSGGNLHTNANGAVPQKRSSSAYPYTILLVEDDSVVRELVARQLQRAGYSVLKTRHSDEALQFNGEFDGPIHLLLTDLCMAPYMNGRKLAERLRPSRPGMRVLYISGFVDDDVVVNEIEHGMANFLPKPFTPDILLESVRLALAQPIAADRSAAA